MHNGFQNATTKMSKDIYTIGICKGCNKRAALKNGYCIDCEKKQFELPDILNDLFHFKK